MTITPTPSGNGYTAVQRSPLAGAPVLGFGHTRALALVDCMQRIIRTESNVR